MVLMIGNLRLSGHRARNTARSLLFKLHVVVIKEISFLLFNTVSLRLRVNTQNGLPLSQVDLVRLLDELEAHIPVPSRGVSHPIEPSYSIKRLPCFSVQLLLV